MTVSITRHPGSRWYTVQDSDYPGTLEVAIGPAPQPTPIALGAWLPANANTTPPWTHDMANQYHALVGSAPALVHWYQDPYIYAAYDVEKRISLAHTAGVVPMVTYEIRDTSADAAAVQPLYTHAAVLAGRHDLALAAYARDAAADGRPMLLRLFHEMTGRWYPWAVGTSGTSHNSNTPESFIAAWRYVVRLFRANGATNVRFVWCPSVEMAGLWDMRDCWPGDAYVDYLGLDGYCWPTGSGNPGGLSFAQTFGPAYATITELSRKPLIICEVGVTENATNKAAWIADMASAAPYVFPRLAAVVWFSNMRGAFDWRLDSTPTSLAAFQQIARQPAMAGVLSLS